MGSIDVKGVERVMQLSDSVNESVDNYYAERDRLFPGLSTVNDMYHALPKDQRKEFIKYYPQLSSYFEWNSNYKDRHPEYDAWNNQRTNYYNEKACYESYAAMSPYTQKQLEYAASTGKKLDDTSLYELNKLYYQYGSPNYNTFDQFVKMLQDWE